MTDSENTETARRKSVQVGGASREMDMDAYLDHSRDGSGGGKFFKMDFKNDGAEHRAWVHPKSKIRAMWRVPWRFINREGKLGFTRWNVMEDASTPILDKMRFKNPDGSFEHAPQVDPFMLLLEFVNMQLQAGTIKLDEPVFRWAPKDADALTVYAGGFTGLFQSKKLSDRELDAIRVINVRRDQAFQQDGRPKEDTIFCLVDNRDPGAGPQIAVVSRGISRAFAECNDRRIVEYGGDRKRVNFFANPVCFCFKKFEKRDAPPEFSVTALSLEVVPLSDDVKKAFEQAVPSIDGLTQASNVAWFRREIEKHWVHKVVPPFDEIFAEAFELVKGTPEAELPEDFPHGANAPAGGASTGGGGGSTASDAGGPTDAGLAPCDSCGKGIPEEVFPPEWNPGDPPVVCPHCGAKYVLNEDQTEWKMLPKEEPKPEPPKRKTPSFRKPRTDATK